MNLASNLRSSLTAHAPKTYDTGEQKVSFLDDCLRIPSFFEVKSGGEVRRLEQPDETASHSYGTNNGYLAFVTKGGLRYVTPASSDKTRELESLGYKATGLGVPLSNNEVPADHDDRAKWQKIVAKAKAVDIEI